MLTRNYLCLFQYYSDSSIFFQSFTITVYYYNSIATISKIFSQKIVFWLRHYLTSSTHSDVISDFIELGTSHPVVFCAHFIFPFFQFSEKAPQKTRGKSDKQQLFFHFSSFFSFFEFLFSYFVRVVFRVFTFEE